MYSPTSSSNRLLWIIISTICVGVVVDGFSSNLLMRQSIPSTSPFSLALGRYRCRSTSSMRCSVIGGGVRKTTKVSLGLAKVTSITDTNKHEERMGQQQRHNYDDTRSNNRIEYVALLSGHRLPIQIGALSLARKAWKKRRRTYSPIMVPCSLISIPHTKSTVRNNIIYLLHKYGQGLSSNNHNFAEDMLGGGKGGGGGIFLPLNKLVSLYNKVLAGNLIDHATLLGYQNLESFLRNIMDSHTKFRYGVELIDYQPWDTTDTDTDTDSNNASPTNIILLSSLPKKQAREWVSKTALVQVTLLNSTQTTNGEHNLTSTSSSVSTTATSTSSNSENRYANNIMMPHTGMVKTYHKSEQNPKQRHFSLVPLGAALRVQQQQQNQQPLPSKSAASTHGNKLGSLQQQQQSGEQQQQQQHQLAGLVEGELMYAHVLQYDATGDDGTPLLTFCLDQRDSMESKIRRNIIAREQEARQFKKSLVEKGILTSTTKASRQGKTARMLSDLRFGEGPLLARVARISARSNAAFVDVGVFRQKGKNAGGGLVQVLGMLRFQELMDATASSSSTGRDVTTFDHDEVQNDEYIDGEESHDDQWFDDEDDDDEPKTIDDLFTMDDDDEEEEEEEDVTHLYETDEDGNLYEIDQDSGEEILPKDTDDHDDEAITASNDVKIDNKKAGKKSSLIKIFNKATPDFLQIGDELNVYINMVSLQSGRFMVTLDPSVQGKSGKEMKKLSNVEKRLSKLTARYGDDGVEKILSLKGTECFGVIKAKSSNWFYVQPDMLELPVGIASGIVDGNEKLADELMPGDRVRIQLDGIDDSRGQLSLKLLGKLLP